jgi:2'-5' RNA ligase
MSHLTIARVKGLKNKDRFLEDLKEIKIPKMNFSIEKFYLKESVLTGKKPIYKDLAAYNLQ